MSVYDLPHEVMYPAVLPVSGKVLEFQKNWDGVSPYALATVVYTAGTTPSKAGDRAIVTDNGDLIGNIGGGCVRHAILKGAALALSEHKPRLIYTKPKEKISESDHRSTDVYATNCPSKGEMSIFIEPVIPRPLLIVFGNTELTDMILKIGPIAGFKTKCCTLKPCEENNNDMIQVGDLADLTALSKGVVVVATQGNGDKSALEAALTSKCPHIFFVSSQKKTVHWKNTMSNAGYTDEQLDRLIAPAGLPIGAQTPGEISIAIIAQAIEIHRKNAKTPS